MPKLDRAKFPTALSLALLVVVACGGDDSTGPGGVEFPTISPADLALYCIRGQITPPMNVSGTISTSDCNDGGNDGYYDTYHVRVASSGSVTFAVSSNFDSWLDLLVVGNVNDIENTTVYLTYDDDSGPGFDALLTYTLQANTDYAILVSGYDDSETGSYTLNVSQ